MLVSPLQNPSEGVPPLEPPPAPPGAPTHAVEHMPDRKMFTLVARARPGAIRAEIAMAVAVAIRMWTPPRLAGGRRVLHGLCQSRSDPYKLFKSPKPLEDGNVGKS